LRTSRFGDLALPIADETGGHLSAQQNRVNGVDQMINEFEEFVIHLAHRPIQFTVRPGHEAIGCDLHLQFQCSHRSPLKFSDRFHFRTDRDLESPPERQSLPDQRSGENARSDDNAIVAAGVML
jgi:hypothetical protein